MTLELYKQKERAKNLENMRNFMAQDATVGSRLKQLSKKVFDAGLVIEVTEEQAHKKLQKYPASERYLKKAQDFNTATEDLARLESKERDARVAEINLRQTLEELQEALGKPQGDLNEMERMLIQTEVTVQTLTQQLDEHEAVRQGITDKRRKAEKIVNEVCIFSCNSNLKVKIIVRCAMR